MMEIYPALKAEKPWFEKVPVRWGMIGIGAVTELKSAPAIYKNRGFELAMVMGRDKNKAADYAARHGISRWTTDAAELVNDPDVDAVYIATPPDSHLHYARMVAEAGKPCCVEKPMAPAYAESLEMFHLFQERNLPLFVSYYRRSLPRFNKIKEILESGGIGTPRHIHWIKTKPPSEDDLNRTYSWRTDPDIAPGGYFDDLACHGLDLFAYLLGNFVQVSGQVCNQQGLYQAPDAITASWVHESGATGTGFWNFASDDYRDEVKIYGERGTLSFSVLYEAAIRLESVGKTQEWEIENPHHIQTQHAENLRRHLMGESAHPSTAYSALHCSWVMDQILQDREGVFS